MGYIIQYELQGTAVNPWAGNSTYINVTGSSDLLAGTNLKMSPNNLSRGGEVVTHQAHNLKIGGANPSPATNL